MIQATLRMMMDPEKFTEAVKILSRTAERARVETGCERCHVYSDTQKANVILMEGAWKSDEELNRLLRSDGFRDVLMVMEMAIQAPEIKFSTITRVTGIERVKAARLVNQDIALAHDFNEFTQEEYAEEGEVA